MDKDIGGNGYFYFWIEEGYLNIFIIDVFGSLKIKIFLDREKKEEYYF